MKRYGINDIRGILDGKSKNFSFEDERSAYSFVQQAYHENRVQHIFRYATRTIGKEVIITKNVL
jgi:hypothetical protein